MDHTKTNLQSEVADALWMVLRECEDKCDLELEDVSSQHVVWQLANIAIGFMRKESLAAPGAAIDVREHYDEVKATLKGLHSLMESLSAIERRVGPLGSHARGYTHKITKALNHLDALASRQEGGKS